MLKKHEIESIEAVKKISLRWLMNHRLNKIEAEDLFQQSLLKAISTSSQLQEDVKISSWFFRILKNTTMDYFRAQKLQKVKEGQYAVELELYGSDSDFENELSDCLREYVSALSLEDQKILEMHFFEGRTLKSISSELSMSESNVRVKALRARERLKLMFKAGCDAKTLNELKNCGCD